MRAVLASCLVRGASTADNHATAAAAPYPEASSSPEASSREPPYLDARQFRSPVVSYLHLGREVIVDDQDQLAAGVPLFYLAVRGGGVLPVIPVGDVDRQ